MVCDGELRVRARLVAALLVAISVSAASCSAPSANGTRTISGSLASPTSHVNCSNSPTDASRLQRTINASRAGAVIEISGTCFLTRGITLLGQRTYTGDGRTATVLRQAVEMRYVMASAAFVNNDSTTGAPLTVQQLTVACSSGGQTDGIVILDWQADVHDVNVSNCGGSGIVDTSQTADGKSITNTSVNSRFVDNVIVGSGANGFRVIDNSNAVTDGYLVDNQIASSRGNAIEMANAAGWRISGNHLYDDVANGIMAERMYGTTISGNYIEDFASRQTDGTWYGIAGSAQDGYGSTIYGNNVFNGAGDNGNARHIYIAITRTNTGTGRVSVTGNEIIGASMSDVAFSFNGGAHNLIVTSSGNSASNVGLIIQHSGSVRISAGI